MENNENHPYEKQAPHPAAPAEPVILIGIYRQETPEAEYRWSEFGELARAAGAFPAATVRQPKPDPDPALFLGSGKADSLAAVVREHHAGLVIAEQELTPIQVRNLEDVTGVRVIDRTNLILDIFAARAQTKEGKLQVELAQLNYLLPRLSRSGQTFSRLGGGIGTRGPGETKLEADRRRVRRRIADLRRELAEVAQHRSIQRHRREKMAIPTVALVGYTNSGKSTLFNRCTASPENGASRTGNRLFETLDPVSRRFALPERGEAILLDTVGFISDLPHQLVAAFRATLEETIRAALLVHVMDCSSPFLHLQHRAVLEVLAELGIAAKDHLTVLNKCDLIANEHSLNRLAKEWDAMPVSALYDRGITELLYRIRQQLFAGIAVCRFMIPFPEAAAANWLHDNGRVLEEEYTEQGVHLRVELERTLVGKVAKYIRAEDEPQC